MKKKLLITVGIVVFLFLAFTAIGLVIAMNESNSSDLFKFRAMDNGYSVEINEKYDGEPLTEIEFPSTYRNQPVIAISYSNFSWKSSIKSVTIPNSVLSLREEPTDRSPVFSGYTSLTTVNFADNSQLKTIENDAFSGCKSLVNINIPDSVTTIGSGAFANCTSLTNITIPDSVTIIGSNAFANCTSLINVAIPNSITSIETEAFKNCNSLKYNEYNNALYLGNATNPYVALIDIKDTDITICTIKESTKVIYSYAFVGCKSLTNITIPDSVISIEYGAFRSCENLNKITIPKSIKKIASDALSYCKSLKSIVYKGTTEEWNAIEKGYWDASTPSYTILCSDGSISKNGTVSPY